MGRPSCAQRLDAVRWQAAAYCHQLLVSDDSAAAARAYLRRTHAYSSGYVRTFHIGWAPPDPTVIPDHLGNVGVSDPDMVAGGVARPGPSRPFARHLGRVLYPIVTGPQRVSGFAAEDSDGGMEHPRHGDRVLFGFGQARSPIARQATAVVVSGYPTVVAYHRVGLANTVAPCSPHMTADQVTTLSRYCDRAVVLTPDDQATRHLLYLPTRSAYNKGLRGSVRLLQHVIEWLARDSPSWWDDVWLVDSTPVECGRSRETQ